ncbi:hypothetical protein Mgra_00000119 [Meloidogyne graminicola]|uniref:Uncharacterized protein n=1 Tax=Meloidogyne graminicola TaxID=189291 RepID=A0A8T0A2G7_9BILA|nr:hypothetical protein Mgra_00000119 [Meloidogyne graminicola]
MLVTTSLATTTMSEEEIAVTILLCTLMIIMLIASAVLGFYIWKYELGNKNVKKDPTTAEAPKPTLKQKLTTLTKKPTTTPAPPSIQLQEKKYSRTETILTCGHPKPIPNTSSYRPSLLSPRPSGLTSIGGNSQFRSERSLPVFSTQPSNSILSHGSSLPPSIICRPTLQSSTPLPALPPSTPPPPTPSTPPPPPTPPPLYPAISISGKSTPQNSGSSASLPRSAPPMTYQEYSCSPSTFNTSYTVISPMPPILFPHQQTSTMKSGTCSSQSYRSSKHKNKGRKYKDDHYNSCHTGRSCSSSSSFSITPSDDWEDRGSLRHQYRHKRRSKSRSRSRNGGRRSRSGSRHSRNGNRRMSRTMKEWRK